MIAILDDARAATTELAPLHPRCPDPYLPRMLVLDGSYGEGGGQILRTALSLSMVTGRPFTLDRVRAGRDRPGLMRQHLAAVRASATVCGADVSGAELGSQRLVFVPAAVAAGEYRFATGSAGSTTLVFQTLLPALLAAKGESKLVLEGGTHNPFAPPLDFIERAFLPLLKRMGAEVNIALERRGFYPAGGGRFTADIPPTPSWSELKLLDRGTLGDCRAESLVANLPRHIAERELQVVRRQLDWPDDRLQVLDASDSPGPGNVLMLTVECENVCEVFTAFGQRGVRAEDVARQAAAEAAAYLRSAGAVGPHLADQLILPLALAGKGAFTTTDVTQHTRTNIWVTQQFLPVRFEIQAHESGAWRVEVRG